MRRVGYKARDPPFEGMGVCERKASIPRPCPTSVSQLNDKVKLNPISVSGNCISHSTCIDALLIAPDRSSRSHIDCCERNSAKNYLNTIQGILCQPDKDKWGRISVPLSFSPALIYLYVVVLMILPLKKIQIASWFVFKYFRSHHIVSTYQFPTNNWKLCKSHVRNFNHFSIMS